jgi:hypothetical protein
MANALCQKMAQGAFGAALRSATKYKFGELGLLIPHDLEPADVHFLQTDVMVPITKDVEEELNPLVVNPTSTQACGEWDLGTDGFEEGLAYRSTLSLSLVDDLYPIERDELVHSPNVYAFRGASYQSVKSFPFAVASLQPMTRADFSVDNDRERFRSSFEAVFQLALKHGHRSIIMNAFGCREDNNPVEIAQLLGQVISRYARAIVRVTLVFTASKDNPLLVTFRKNVKVVPEAQYKLELEELKEEPKEEQDDIDSMLDVMD